MLPVEAASWSACRSLLGCPTSPHIPSISPPNLLPKHGFNKDLSDIQTCLVKALRKLMCPPYINWIHSLISSWSEKAIALKSFPRGTFIYTAWIPQDQTRDMQLHSSTYVEMFLFSVCIFTPNFNYLFLTSWMWKKCNSSNKNSNTIHLEHLSIGLLVWPLKIAKKFPSQ